MTASWAVVGAVLLVALILVAVTLDGMLAARAQGGSVKASLRWPAAETARLLRQRRRSTVAADSLLWRIGGAGMLVAALLKITVIPFGEWTLFDFEAGLVWFNAMDVLVWAFVWLVGWGGNSAHALVGGYRFLALAVAYELPLMFALIAPAIASESLNVGSIVAAQSELWFIVWMPVAFLIYSLGVVAFSLWGPFGSPMGSDIAGGVAAELSGVDRLIFFLGRYGVLVAGAAFAVPLFLGGGSGEVLPAWAWSLVKTLVVLAVFVWVRRKIPVVRPDKFMEVGWVLLIPAGMLQDLMVALVVVNR
ncbi:NADH-quinone oxidoreductase subunit H [Microbacterium esteraromaticum]|uniref:complex I subunit 1 family protein n=1 Tax=Microbacterium esteraromaticum TaxID=57043 RepID=UPI0030B151E8